MITSADDYTIAEATSVPEIEPAVFSNTTDKVRKHTEPIDTLRRRDDLKELVWLRGYPNTAAVHAKPHAELTTAFGPNKRRAFAAQVRLAGAKVPRACLVVEYASVPTTSAGFSAELVEQQVRELQALAAVEGHFAPRLIGYIVRRQPVVFEKEAAAVYQLDAFVVEAIEGVEFTLQQILVRTDIHTLGPLGFFVRQLLTLMTWAASADVVLRNVDPSKTVVHRAADRTMLVKYCDFSAACFTGAPDAHLYPTADRRAPEVGGPHAAGTPTAASDMYCLGWMLLKSIAVAVKAVHGVVLARHADGTPLTYAEIDEADAEALRSKLKELTCRSDNGIIALCLVALDPKAWRRPSAAAALRGLNPQVPVTFTNIGSITSRVAELPFVSEFDWDQPAGSKTLPAATRALLVANAAQTPTTIAASAPLMRMPPTTTSLPQTVTAGRHTVGHSMDLATQAMLSTRGTKLLTLDVPVSSALHRAKAAEHALVVAAADRDG